MQKKNKQNAEQGQKKGRLKKILLLLLISIVAAALLIPNMIYRINEGLVEQEAMVDDLDVSGFSEKTFTGSYSSGHMHADVEVTVINGQYTDIKLTDSSGINPARADKVIAAIIHHQTITPDEGDIGEQFTDIILQKAVYYAIRYNYSTD